MHQLLPVNLRAARSRRFRRAISPTLLLRALLPGLGLLVVGSCTDSAASPQAPVSTVLVTDSSGATAGTGGTASTTVPSDTVAPVTTPPVATTTGPSATTQEATIAQTVPATDTSLAGMACIDALSVAFRAGQVVMPAVYGDRLPDYGAELKRMNVGGVILMTWPAGTDPAALSALKVAASPPVMVGVDEEGGSVQRLKALGALPSERTVAATMSPDAARTMIAEHAVKVKALGIDIVFAPVVDVGPVEGTGPIGKRAFGTDPATVTAYAAAYIDGWESGGILPVLKHFPGHGSASGDSHTGRVTTPPLSELATRDLVPYVQLADRRTGVMVGHLDVPGLTDADDRPASLSPAAITGLLRDQLGYHDSLVFTDALGMDAVSSRWSVPDAAVLSLAAGADVVLYTSISDTEAVIAAIEAAVADGSLSPARLDQAVAHVLANKQVDPCTL